MVDTGTPITEAARRDLASTFGNRLKRDANDAVIVRAPGRLNLLGEHTDYNQGFVLPIAINRATWVVAAPARGRVRVWSEAMQQEDEFDPTALRHDKRRHWGNYVRAVVWALAEIGVPVPGADLLVTGDLPLGAGVSSSASLEMACALALLSLQSHELPRRDLALLCQRAENEFVGVRCGIMDQFAVGLSQAHHALLLDCRSLETKLVPLNGDSPVFFVCDTSKPRTLAASAYNQRRSECESAANHFGVPSLREVTLEMLQGDRDALLPVIFRRCHHVITENDRVLQAVELISSGRWQDFGCLLNASHYSLRDDYEVSCEELDIMCELARQHPGCLGARMVGAGFGGAALAAVERAAADDFARYVAPRYEAATSREPRIFAAEPAGGAEVVSAS